MADDEDDPRPTPHDRLAKRILTDPEAAGVELRHVLPRRISEWLDFDDIHVESSAFVNARLGTYHSDIVYSIAIKGTHQRVLVYVVLEHQSGPDGMMPWRVYEYVGYLWERYVAGQRGRARTLPFVIPIVLAQCEHGWTAPYRLSELFDLPDELREIFGTPIELELLVDELDGSVMDDAVARPGIVALVEAMRVLMMAHHRSERLDEAHVAEVGALFETVMRTLGRPAVQTLWVYIISVFGPKSPFRDTLLRVIDEEQQDMYDAVREEWLKVYQPAWLIKHKEELLAEGEAKGKAEGEAKGRAEAKIELLLGLLERRGIAVSAAQRERVLGTTDELQLQRWFERAVTASGAHEVFEPTTRDR